MESNTLKVQELAKMLGINVTRAYQIARQPGFPSVRLGRRIVVIRDQVEPWLMKQSQNEK